jgi:hypothetical protein
VITLTAHHGDTEEKALDLGARDHLTESVRTRPLIGSIRPIFKHASMC